VDDDVVTGHPVDGGGDLVLVASLEGVDDAENLDAVAASGSRVGEDGSDNLLGVNDEDRADGKGDALLIHVGGVLVVDPRGLCELLAMGSPQTLRFKKNTYMS